MDVLTDEEIQTKTHRILSLIKSHKANIQAFGVLKLGLFGSVVRGQQQADSDVDLLVEFVSGKKTFDNFIHLSFFLEDLLEKRIEVVTLESVSPYIRPHIMKEVEYVTFTD
jgi:hypothetical protein